ncbi:hypothetical protein C8R47DRAFT_513706 [Mycena vitilis]|nr:hypothetical protein C8R47DRAFT_513706 [Mycena vitilis]
MRMMMHILLLLRRRRYLPHPLVIPHLPLRPRRPGSIRHTRPLRRRLTRAPPPRPRPMRTSSSSSTPTRRSPPRLPPSRTLPSRSRAPAPAARCPPHVAWTEEAYPASPLSATASSFAHTNRTSTGTRTSGGSALPPHVAWAEEAYPASPRSVAHPYGDSEYGYDGEEDGEGRQEGREEGREEGTWEDGREEEWSPTSDAREVSMQAMQTRAGTIV